MKEIMNWGGRRKGEIEEWTKEGRVFKEKETEWKNEIETQGL